jgi:ABC-type ATPase involved in cell division
MLLQLFVVGAAGAGVWLALRWMRTEFARVDGEIRRAERMLERLRGAPMPQLRFDPESGHYRPVER